MPRSRSRSRSRDRDRRRRSRSRDRIRRHSRSRSPRRRSRSPLERRRASRSPHAARSRRTDERKRSPGRDKRRDKDRPGQKHKDSFDANVPITDEDASMKQLMGFSNFDTTKNKKVDGNYQGAAMVSKKRKYRQYMNRKGGFNRPLDPIS